MEVTNINIDDLTIDINGETKEITYALLLEINDFNDGITHIDATACEGTVIKWVFSAVPDRYVLVLADDSVISDKDNEYHDSIEPENAFDFRKKNLYDGSLIRDIP